jgi:ATP-dependent Clp protease ATP-binding subunit ClpB
MSGAGNANAPWPAWLAELDHALAFHPHFILAGNIRDLHLVPTEDGLVPASTIEAIWALLERRGYRYLLRYDPVDQLQVIAPTRREEWPPGPPFDAIAPEGRGEIAFPSLIGCVRAIQPSGSAPGLPGAMAIDYASRVASPASGPNPELDAFFAACEKLSHTAQPRGLPSGSPPPYNPVLWLANSASDLP